MYTPEVLTVFKGTTDEFTGTRKQIADHFNIKHRCFYDKLKVYDIEKAILLSRYYNDESRSKSKVNGRIGICRKLNKDFSEVAESMILNNISFEEALDNITTPFDESKIETYKYWSKKLSYHLQSIREGFKNRNDRIRFLKSNAKTIEEYHQIINDRENKKKKTDAINEIIEKYSLSKNDANYFYNNFYLKELTIQDFYREKTENRIKEAFNFDGSLTDFIDLLTNLEGIGVINNKIYKMVTQRYIENRTLVEIGGMYGCTRQCVEQIIKRGVNKINYYLSNKTKVPRKKKSFNVKESDKNFHVKIKDKDGEKEVVMTHEEVINLLNIPPQNIYPNKIIYVIKDGITYYASDFKKKYKIKGSKIIIDGIVFEGSGCVTKAFEYAADRVIEVIMIR